MYIPNHLRAGTLDRPFSIPRCDLMVVLSAAFAALATRGMRSNSRTVYIFGNPDVTVVSTLLPVRAARLPELYEKLLQLPGEKLTPLKRVGLLSSLESHSSGRFGVDARRTDNGARLFQLCADHELFLASTNFKHKRSHCVTWRPQTTNQPWTQLDHVATSHRWRATIQDCRSFWGTPLDSDHAVVRARLTVRFPSGHCKSARSIPIHYLRRTAVAQQYRSKIAQQLSTVKQYCGGSEHVDEAWQNVKGEMLAAFSPVCPTSPIRPLDVVEVVVHD
ncbi:hypothetical protein T265_05251 [Opisthorchis viverrini]|uniref:Endonuclease/exonuclease/phosphatase domain-containing protein n=1 Tax=Opisthorchis viverrini TaxID=6198 RepID=A0A074ZL30_OPIVI|nr:hypothetical protein T265_05251 [Opisthorchis viverrini]KER27761.1 hypothetical protein T265_05251 [Opisthorchis viverrini]